MDFNSQFGRYGHVEYVAAVSHACPGAKCVSLVDFWSILMNFRMLIFPVV